MGHGGDGYSRSGIAIKRFPSAEVRNDDCQVVSSMTNAALPDAGKTAQFGKDVDPRAQGVACEARAFLGML
jgi:hypothetical protein